MSAFAFAPVMVVVSAIEADYVRNVAAELSFAPGFH